MSQWVYVVAGWAVVISVLGGYALRLVIRGRTLSRQVPQERRRWAS